MHALTVLDFDSVRLRLADHCETALGVARAAALMPSFDADEVWQRQAFTAEATRASEERLGLSLVGLHDVREPVALAGKGSVLGGEVLARVASSLRVMRVVGEALRMRRDGYPLLAELAARMPALRELEEKLGAALDASGDVKDSASPALASVRGRKASASAQVLQRIQAYTTGGKRDLLSDPIYTQRDGRYVVPVKVEYKARIKGVVHGASASGQTVYVEPEDVLAAANKLREFEAAEAEEIERILTELSTRVGAAAPQIVDGLDAAGELDFTLAKARSGGCLPERAPGHMIEIVEGRHPLLDPATAVPLTLKLGDEHDAVLITGPNTGGKTVAIKTVGLLVAMAQCGMMLPARHVRLGAFTGLWADIGDEQSLQQSLSTFSGHIKNVAEALREVERGGLVLLDEIGAGTDPAEGAALAKAVLREFQARGARVLASTHYGELKVFAYSEPGFTNAAMEFDTKTLRPTYRLMMGAPGASHALRIAERYGVPKEVVESARGDLGVDRLDVAHMIEKLETAQKQAQRAQGEADRRAAELERLRKEAERLTAEAAENRRSARQSTRRELEDEIRRIRQEAKEVFESLKGDSSGRAVEQARKRLREIQSAALPPPDEPSPLVSGEPVKLAVGDSVLVRGYNQVGTVYSAPKKGRVEVRVGAMRLTVPVEHVSPSEAVQPVAPPPKARGTKRTTDLRGANLELHLRRLRAEDASEALDRFLDDAVLSGLPFVRIVHGKGGGVLREITRAALKRHPDVRSYHSATPDEGGDGVTVAHFE